jgi:hypothetical protein
LTASDTGRRVDLLTVRGLLDDALVGLARVDKPAPPIAAAKDDVAGALEHVYRALANATDYELVRGESELAMERCREALGALQYRETTDQGVLADIALVAQALGALRSNARVPEDVVLDLPRRGTVERARASTGEPVPIDLDRDVLLPNVPMHEIEEEPEEEPPETPPVPEIHSAEDLARWVEFATSEETPDDDSKLTMRAPPRASKDIDVDKITATVFGTAEVKDDVIGDWVDGFYEDLGMMSLMRQASEDDVWHELAPVEDRLLARVDAIAAAGPTYFGRIIERLMDTPVPDPQHAWAAIYFYGSLRGSDAADQVARLARSFDLSDAAMFESVSDALSFVPNRGVETFARALLDDPSEDLRALALRVLGRRSGLAVPEVVGRMANTTPRILVELFGALETAGGVIDPVALRAGLASPDPAVFTAAAECALARGAGVVLSYARSHLRAGRGAFGNAALVCAIAGNETDRDLLFEAAAADPTPVVLDALGWCGSTTVVPFLIGRLRAGEAGSLPPLQRLTGASLTAESVIETNLPPEERPFTRKRRPPEVEILLSDDAELWQAWWDELGRDAQPQKRYRFGHAWSVADNLWELQEGPGTWRTRRIAYLELVARTGIQLPVDTRAFVVRQQRQIKEWDEALAVRRDRAPEGRWTTTFG